MAIFNVKIAYDGVKKVKLQSLGAVDIRTVDEVRIIGIDKFTPIVLSALPNQTVSIGAQKDVDISGVFSDADVGNREVGILDKLTLTASSSATNQCGASIYENSSGVAQLRLAGYAAGTPTITLTATDLHNNSVTDVITVTVS